MSEIRDRSKTHNRTYDTVYKTNKVFAGVVDTGVFLRRLIDSVIQFTVFNLPQNRVESGLIDNQTSARMLRRSFHNDRVFPLETIRVKEYNRKTDAELGNVTIHTGPYADEYVRSFNALAVTIANEIYFRNGAYKPETEEGRKTLAHELTHVGQYTERRITGNTSRKELESEAEQAEGEEEYDPDAAVVVCLNNKYFSLLRSEMPIFAGAVADNIVRWIGEQKVLLEEPEYCTLLCGVDEWLKEV